MAKSDINLFKAAGGERAKSGKSSPVSIMIVVGIVIVVAALGVAAYFNLRVSSANNNFKKKERMLNNYNSTINDPEIQKLSDEYKMIINDIDATAAINVYVETRSALYPEATSSEIMAVRNTIRSNPIGYKLTTSKEEDEMDRKAAGLQETEEPEEEEPEEEEESLKTIDYEALRAYLYNDEVESFTDRELFYYALDKLAKKQAASEDGVWYAYYRCYFVMVFTGGDDFGIQDLITSLASTAGTMGGQTPFSTFMMQNGDEIFYIPAKYKTIEYEDVYYQIVMMPMKTVIERAYDILSARSTALIIDNDWQGQPENAHFEMKEIVFTNEELVFQLVLPKTGSLMEYMKEFDASYFFEVDYSVLRPEGDIVTDDTNSFSIKLKYKNRPELETPEEE